MCPFALDGSFVWVGLSDGRLLRVETNGNNSNNPEDERLHPQAISHILVSPAVVITISVDGSAQIWTKRDRLDRVRARRELNMTTQTIAARSSLAAIVSTDGAGTNTELWLFVNRTIDVCAGLTY